MEAFLYFLAGSLLAVVSIKLFSTTMRLLRKIVKFAEDLIWNHPGLLLIAWFLALFLQVLIVGTRVPRTEEESVWPPSKDVIKVTLEE